jgi:formamidopyrimidine-DNA glycosylase
VPELPEVEEVRRSLEPHIVGKRVTAVRVDRADFVVGGPLDSIIGRRFETTHRHGKKLFCILDDGQTILIHLGMSGRIDVVPREAEILSHTHVILTLDSGQQVRQRDPRRFGGMWHYPSFAAATAAEITDKLGPDALQITAADFDVWIGQRGHLKPRLLGQRDVAGLGNIYVDESLWMAHLHPLQIVWRIRPAEKKALVKAIHEVLRRSIGMGGTTLRDYRNVSDQPGAFVRELRVYGRGGKPCKRCGTTLRSATIGGRTTVHCPVCQRRH